MSRAGASLRERVAHDGPRLRAHVETRAFAFRLHLVTLALGFLFLMWVNRNQWFNLDEWSMLVDRQLVGDGQRPGLLEPFNEHWTTLSLLIYRIQYNLFGLRSYFPYLLVLALFQTLSAHLLWRVMLRSGALPLVAVAGAAIYLVLGAGAEMLTNAYGITNVAPVVCGLGALLVVAETGPFGRRDVAAWVLLVAALMFQSGAGVPFVAVVGALVLFTRGIRLALAVVSVPAAVFAVWYLVYGGDATGFGRVPFKDGIQVVPEFVWTGLKAAFDETTGLEGIAPVLIVLLAIWVVRQASGRDPGTVMALALAGGAILELVLITFGRGAFGPLVATSSRYLLIVVPMLLPLVGLAASRGMASIRMPLIALGVVTAIVLVVQTSAMNRYANTFAAIEQEQKHRIVAAAEVLRGDEEPIWGTIVPDNIPNLVPARLQTLDAEGRLPSDVEVSEEDRLTARAYFQVALTVLPRVEAGAPARLVEASGTRVAPTDEEDCVAVESTADGASLRLRFEEPSNIEIDPQRSGFLTIALAQDGVQGRARPETVTGGQKHFLSVGTSPIDVVMTYPATGETLLCGVVDDTQSGSEP